MMDELSIDGSENISETRITSTTDNPVIYTQKLPLDSLAEYLRSDEVEDPLYGLERAPYVEATRARFGEKAAREIDYLMDRNAALFAGGEVTQEQKDAYFEAVMQAYLACKQAARASYGRKKNP